MKVIRKLNLQFPFQNHLIFYIETNFIVTNFVIIFLNSTGAF